MAKENFENEETDPIVSAINGLNSTLEEIDNIFEKELEDKYAEGFLLLGSILEEFLRILIMNRFTFSKHYFDLDIKVQEAVGDYLDNLKLYGKIKMAVMLNLIDNETYKALESFRKQRNKIHIFFVDNQRPDFKELYEISDSTIRVLIKKLKYYLKKIDYL